MELRFMLKIDCEESEAPKVVEMVRKIHALFDYTPWPCSLLEGDQIDEAAIAADAEALRQAYEDREDELEEIRQLDRDDA